MSDAYERSEPCAVFDLEVALERVDGDWDTLRRVIASYRRDAGLQVARLRAAVEAGDATKVERTAHSFKGTLLVLGAERAGAVAEALENLGRAGRLEGAAATTDTLAGELRRLDRAIGDRATATREVVELRTLSHVESQCAAVPGLTSDTWPSLLVADDDEATRLMLAEHLRRWGYDVDTCQNGREALRRIESASKPMIVLLDWLMPEVEGDEVCRAARSRDRSSRPYIIMLTSRDRPEDLVAALDAGADDYVAKPHDPAALRARIRVGVRMLQLQQGLADRVDELERALRRVRQLEEFLPMCSYCKKIRDEKGAWHPVESYLAQRTDSQVSHGICPECNERIVEPMIREFKSKDDD